MFLMRKIARVVDDVGAHLHVVEHESGHLETSAYLSRGGEDDILEELEVAVVAEGEVGREEGDLVGKALQSVTLAAHYLEDVGVLLVGHDR